MQFYYLDDSAKFCLSFLSLANGCIFICSKDKLHWHFIRISCEFWFQESYYFWNIFPLKPGTTLFQVGLASVNWRINIMPASSWPNNKEQRKIRKISTKKGNFRRWKEIGPVAVLNIIIFLLMTSFMHHIQDCFCNEKIPFFSFWKKIPVTGVTKETFCLAKWQWQVVLLRGLCP